jgi:hypothetical protein
MDGLGDLSPNEIAILFSTILGSPVLVYGLVDLLKAIWPKMSVTLAQTLVALIAGAIAAGLAAWINAQGAPQLLTGVAAAINFIFAAVLHDKKRGT